MSDRETIERAFARIRAELEIRTAFPPAVLEAADLAATRTGWREDASRISAEETPFVTIDPAGSRDLDQALYLERLGDGFRVHYAIADVACFVERGGSIEAEALLRGLTYYSPDRRDPLYPPVISQGAGSLLPDEPRPAVLFLLDLDARGALVGASVRRAVIRSRAQLTYPEALDHIEGGGARFRAEPWSASLLLLKDVGELRMARERERGGVSLPILDQRVNRETAALLGYELVYEEPSIAEEWNAQISLLTGHAAAERMLAAGVGLLRTAPPPGEDDVRRLRTAAGVLGFEWPAGASYPDFIHSLSPSDPRIPTLVWQARHLMRGADYVAFDGALPEHRIHAGLAMTYAHCTAPLRRLADRYTLDLLVQLEEDEIAPEAHVARLAELPAIMDAAEKRSNQLDRRIVDVAEAWQLKDAVGSAIDGVVLESRSGWVEVQTATPPIRSRVPRAQDDAALELGAMVRVRVDGVKLEEGVVELSVE